MIFTKLQHIQITHCIHEIFNYLYKNYVQRIRSQINMKFNFEDKDYYFTIYPNRYRCFEITDRDNNLYIINDSNNINDTITSDLFINGENKDRKVFNLSDYDNLMFIFIKEWEFILDRCNKRIEEDNNNLELINNFKIE